MRLNIFAAVVVAWCAHATSTRSLVCLPTLNHVCLIWLLLYDFRRNMFIRVNRRSATRCHIKIYIIVTILTGLMAMLTRALFIQKEALHPSIHPSIVSQFFLTSFSLCQNNFFFIYSIWRSIYNAPSAARSAHLRARENAAEIFLIKWSWLWCKWK